ncbi:hypothetical protein HHK36_030042 [Tetracentron sinense]|uniref:Uncharacterized protein n=1 Tax=Tetracentron sinense TaxID=13715 RepID=A0A834YBY3_TETSI|nr:hypothetical protein HHK36_030042 [Tetracentron sinense]
MNQQTPISEKLLMASFTRKEMLSNGSSGWRYQGPLLPEAKLEDKELKMSLLVCNRILKTNVELDVFVIIDTVACTEAWGSIKCPCLEVKDHHLNYQRECSDQMFQRAVTLKLRI